MPLTPGLPLALPTRKIELNSCLILTYSLDIIMNQKVQKDFIKNERPKTDWPEPGIEPGTSRNYALGEP